MTNLKEYAKDRVNQFKQDAELAYQDIKLFCGCVLFAFTGDEKKRQGYVDNIIIPAGKRILCLEKKSYI